MTQQLVVSAGRLGTKKIGIIYQHTQRLLDNMSVAGIGPKEGINFSELVSTKYNGMCTLVCIYGALVTQRDVLFRLATWCCLHSPAWVRLASISTGFHLPPNILGFHKSWYYTLFQPRAHGLLLSPLSSCGPSTALGLVHIRQCPRMCYCVTPFCCRSWFLDVMHSADDIDRSPLAHVFLEFCRILL